MKKILLIALLLVAPVVLAQDEQAAIKKSIQTFFKGMYARDTMLIKSVCMDNMVFHSVLMGKNGNRFSIENPAAFLKSIAETPKTEVFDERLLDYTIQQDGGIAQVWTPYEFYFNNKLSHSGTNAFTLVKENGTWKISYIIDTRRASGQ